MGRTQSDFAGIAAAAGVPGATRQSQAKYEKDLQSPSATYLRAIAAAGVDISFVVTGKTAHERAVESAALPFSAGVEALRVLRMGQLTANERPKSQHVPSEELTDLEALLDNWQRCNAGDRQTISQLAARLAGPPAPPPGTRKPKA